MCFCCIENKVLSMSKKTLLNAIINTYIIKRWWIHSSHMNFFKMSFFLFCCCKVQSICKPVYRFWGTSSLYSAPKSTVTNFDDTILKTASNYLPVVKTVPPSTSATGCTHVIRNFVSVIVYTLITISFWIPGFYPTFYIKKSSFME